MTIKFTVNGISVVTDHDPNMPLLWFIRDELGLMGTKFGCGVSLCGACTIHVNGEPIRSCVYPLETAADKTITTIEGLAGSEIDPVQKAWVAGQVPQCGYCQSGMIMATVALLESNPDPSDSDIDRAITNICRCGTYPRIRKAIHAAAASKRIGTPQSTG